MGNDESSRVTQKQGAAMGSGESIWVFVGESKGVGGVFKTVEKASEWIAHHALSGLLTEYPVDSGAYDWAVARGMFRPTKDDHRSSQFIGSFVSAKMRHHHFEHGRLLA